MFLSHLYKANNVKLALFLALFCGGFISACHSQFKLHQTVNFGLHSGIYRSKTLTQWINQYNELNAPALNRKLYNFGPSVGYEFGYNVIFDNSALDMYLPFRYNYGRSHVKAKFSDGTERHFELRRNSFLMSLGAGVSDGNDKNLVGVYFSLAFAYSIYELSTFYKYRDGTESFGVDKLINGVYRNIDVKIGGDLTFLFTHKRFGFLFNVSFLSPFMSGDRVMSDNLNGTSLFVESQGKSVMSKFNDFNLSFGINYRLKSFE